MNTLSSSIALRTISSYKHEEKAGGKPESEARQLLRSVLQHVILFPVLKMFLDEFEVTGLENLSGIKGPCVYVANHSSHADTAVILLALPQEYRSRLAIAAAADYFYQNKIIAAIVTLILNTFAFDRQHPLIGFKKAKEVVRHGNSLLIYPEGTRTMPGNSSGFKPGFALLARQLGVPVVPIGLEGSYEMLPKGSGFPKRSSVRVAIGSPIYPQGQSSEELMQATEVRVNVLAHVA